MKLSDGEVISLIEDHEQTAYGINDAELAAERARAISLYLGEPLGNEVEGRSQVISYDVQEVVESALAQLLKPFVAGEKVIEFTPKNLEDQAAADQETAYVNHVITERNNWLSIAYAWFKDALISKNGYVKCWYEEEYDSEEENYRGLTDGQLQMLASNPDVTIEEHEQFFDELGTSLHNVKIKVSETRGCVKIINVAPENMMVSTDCPGLDLNKASFVQHREYQHPSELREQGFDVPDDIATYELEDDEEALARDLYGEDEVNDGKVLVKDTYIKIDGERWRYVVVGSKVIHKEESEIVPFACLTPMMMPHRHIGRSYADITQDIQLIKTTLIRQTLDAMYLANQPRFAVSDRVSIADMLVSRPGGIVRVQGEPGMAIMPLVANPVPPQTFSLVEYFDAMKEKRTGITAYNQGLDANSLNKTATGIQQIMSASQERISLVSRLFAETGVKDLFRLVHRLVRMNYTRPDVMRLNNQWVDVDPRQWKTRTDLSVSVGLGTGNKDQQLMHLMQILQVQEKAMAIGVATPQNIYNAVAKLTQNAGFKNPEEFWTNPSMAPPQPPKPSPEEIKMQGQMQIEQMKLQNDQQKFQAETQLKQQEAEKQLMQEQVRSQNDVQIEQAKIAAQMELERYKAQLEAETELAKAQMQIEAQKEIALVEAQIKQVEIRQQAEVDAERMNREDMRHREQIDAMTKAKRVVRDQNGRVAGVE